MDSLFSWVVLTVVCCVAFIKAMVYVVNESERIKHEHDDDTEWWA
jgi:hypothetical protein